MAFRRKRRFRRFRPRGRRIRKFRRFVRGGRKRRGSRGQSIKFLRLKQPSCMPDALFVKLKWNYREFIDSGLATAYSFQMNNPYLPSSAAQNRALGWDQFALFYQRYHVRSSTIYIKLQSASSAVISRCVCYPSNNATADSVDECIQYPYAKYKILGSQNGAESQVRFKQYFSTRKMFGHANNEEHQWTGAVDGSPPFVRYHVLATEVADPATMATAHWMEVMIIYNVHFYSRQDLENSEIPVE